MARTTWADTITVCSSGCDYVTIQAAVSAAAPNDTINVMEGTYIENVTISTTLTIRGTGAGSTIIDGNANGTVLIIRPGIVVTMTDLGITNGLAISAPGIFNQGTLFLDNTIISNNKAVCCTSKDGGGIHNAEFSIATIKNSIIMSNTALNKGGGIYNAGMMAVYNTDIHHNQGLNGGGIYNRAGTITIDNSVTRHNSGNGGGIVTTGLMTVTNSTISGNYGGIVGGVRTQVGVTTLIHSTIAFNESYGLRSWDNGTIKLANSIVANNTSEECNVAFNGMILSLDFNLSSDTSCNLISSHDLPDTDPLLGALTDNGGDTVTHAPALNSPALDKGNCNSTISDQRGQPRPVNLPMIDNTDDGCDIGAYEVGPRLTLTKIITPTRPNPGDTITYTIVLSNSSSISATNALISDTLPLGLNFVGPITLNPSSGTPGNAGTLPTLVHQLTITGWEQVTVTFPVTIDTNLIGGQVITNGAAVTSTEITAPIIDEVSITISNNPGITVSKIINVKTANIGETITYTYRVTNTGNVSLTNLVASDTPLGVVSLNKDSLTPGQDTTGILTYTTVEGDLPGPLTNTVVVTGTFLTNKITATTEANVALAYNAALTLSKTANVETASVGETITYTYRVTNTGNVSLTNLIASDTPLGAISLNKNNLPPGQGTTGILTYTVVENDLPGPLTNTIVVTGVFLTEEITGITSMSVTLLENSSDNHVYLPVILKND